VSAGELYGGVERHLAGLASYLKGHTSHLQVFLFHDRELAREMRANGIEPVILPPSHPLDPRQIRRVREILREYSIEVVHTHGYKATVLAGLAIRPCRIALVKTEHGRIEPTPGQVISWLKSRLYTGLDLWATRSAGATVCYVTRDLQNHFGSAHDRLTQHVVYNGINPISPAQYSRPDEYDSGFFHVVILGRIDTVKGIDHAIRAMQFPEMPRSTILNIIGDGPLLEQYRTLAHHLGVSDRVRLHGFRPEAYGYLAHADALLLPSLHEGLPYTLLEAMSLGLPVIASRVGGLAEVLEDGRTALLVPPMNPRAIADALATLHADPALAGKLGNAAALEQRQHFDLSTMGTTYLAVYRDAIATTCARS